MPILKKMGLRSGTVRGVFALHVAVPSLISNIPYGPISLPGLILEKAQLGVSPKTEQK